MANADATDAQVLTMQDAPTLEFSCGIDGAQRWIDKILRSSLKLKSSLSKSELVSIIQTGEHHDIEWANEELIREKTPSLTTSQVAAIVAVQDKRCAQDLLNIDASRIAVNAFLLSLMGKTSLEVLMADPIYRENDAGSQDPTISWARITATHVSEREGPGLQKTVMATNQLLIQYTSMRMGESEGPTDFLLRRERVRKAILTHGLDIESVWLDTEENEVIHFLYSMDTARYGGLIRDIANGVVEVPASLTDLISIARDRKELNATLSNHEKKETDTATANQRTAVLVTSRQENQRDPLIPHPRYSAEEWTAFTADERAAILKHNANIKNAAAALPPSTQRSRYNGSNKIQQDDAAQPRVRKQRRQAGAATLLTNHTDTDESDVDTNIVLATLLRDNTDNRPIIPFLEKQTNKGVARPT